ncbi:MAG: hypothetical protein DHS20C08_20010 [Rhodomicrobium sp.]|nr:MAG: hypothetical protein DHS20C08_20010 [Rhodomicrobium sp.]
MAAAATRGKQKKSLLPDSVEQGLKDGAIKMSGAVLTFIALACWVALMSWSVGDPSLNRATDEPIRNLFGKPGAILADILFQSFGLAASFIILPVAVEGVRLILDKPASNFKIRLICWPVSMALIALTLTLLPRANAWPLPQSYGGIIGDTLSKLINLHEMTVSSPLSVTIAFLILAALSLAALSIVTGIRPSDLSILFHIEDKAAFREKLRAPLNRLGYWWRARSIRANTDAGNQRQWWRNAMDDEPAFSSYNERQAAAQNPISGQNQTGGKRSPHIMPPPVTPYNNSLAQPHAGQKLQNQSPMGHPPMSANPRYRGEDAPPLYDFDQGETAWATGGLDPADPAAATQPLAAPHMLTPASMHPKRGEFILPPVELLSPPAYQETSAYNPDELKEMAVMLENVLMDFGVKGSILNVRPGPVVTLFEFEPARGIKTSRIVGLSDDIARSMSAFSARIAVIPGRNAIGIELPNASFETVYLRELVETNDFLHAEETLPLILGKGIGGEPVITDLATMPHLLIAGTTGSGKSVGINTMLLSLLYRLTPQECRMIMIDPKMLELSVYDGIPHLLTPVVTEPSKAVSALKWAVREMEDRYRKMSKLGVRNIEGYNDRIREAERKGAPLNRRVQTGFDPVSGQAIFEEEELDFDPMPMIVVVIDEMADLMIVAGKEIEAAVQRLAQMARAAGIHVIMATQRPSVDVITGTIKANFPTRISFQVTSKIDSRTILGKEGAEQLLGRGDMLFMPGGSRLMRVHGAFVGDEEVIAVTNHLRAQGVPEYLDSVTLDDEEIDDGNNGEPGSSGDLYSDAIDIVLRDRKATISYLQRRLSIGYNKAATLIERMETEGIVSPAGRNGKREILIEED